MKKMMLMIVALAMLAPSLMQSAFADGKYKETTITVATTPATTAYADFDIYDFANPWLEIERIFAANTSGTGNGTVVWTLRDADVTAATIWTSPGVGAGIISNGLPRTAEISIGQTNCVNWAGRKLRATVTQTAVTGATTYKVGVYLK